MKSRPVSASNKEISFSINKSAPFLWNNLCFFSLMTITTSPASASGTSSPSPCLIYFSPLGAPLSTSTAKFFDSFFNFFPLHVLHNFDGSID